MTLWLWLQRFSPKPWIQRNLALKNVPSFFPSDNASTVEFASLTRVDQKLVLRTFTPAEITKLLATLPNDGDK